MMSNLLETLCATPAGKRILIVYPANDRPVIEVADMARHPEHSRIKVLACVVRWTPTATAPGNGIGA